MINEKQNIVFQAFMKEYKTKEFNEAYQDWILINEEVFNAKLDELNARFNELNRVNN
jgi:hypothetical protein